MSLPLKRIGPDSDRVPFPEEECWDVGDDWDEPGCNDCDGFVYEGDTCESCGLKGNIPRRHSLPPLPQERSK